MSITDDELLERVNKLPFEYIVEFYNDKYENDEDVETSLMDKIMDVMIEKAFQKEVGVYIDKRFDRLDWILAELIEFGGDDKFIKANQLMQNLMNTQMDSKACSQALMTVAEFDDFGVTDANVKQWLDSQKTFIQVVIKMRKKGFKGVSYDNLESYYYDIEDGANDSELSQILDMMTPRVWEFDKDKWGHDIEGRFEFLIEKRLRFGEFDKAHKVIEDPILSRQSKDFLRMLSVRIDSLGYLKDNPTVCFHLDKLCQKLSEYETNSSK